mmetsp:Transcript_7523/g.22034  ORF Transcript_7523/g.22034 Transcript_7523/m.22034 type:complete len:306 (+) Transcript_7523:308-1225(+)
MLSQPTGGAAGAPALMSASLSSPTALGSAGATAEDVPSLSPAADMASASPSAGGGTVNACTLALRPPAAPTSSTRTRLPGGIVATFSLSRSSLARKMAPFRPTTSHSSPTATVGRGGGSGGSTGCCAGGAGCCSPKVPCNAEVSDVSREAQLPWAPPSFSRASSSSSSRSCCLMENSLSATFSLTSAAVSSLEASAVSPLAESAAAVRTRLMASSSAVWRPSPSGMAGAPGPCNARRTCDMTLGRRLAARNALATLPRLLASYSASAAAAAPRSCRRCRSTETSRWSSQFSLCSSSLKSLACSRS